MKKIVLPGIIAGAVMLMVSFLLGYVTNPLFGVSNEYENNALFRPWSDPLMSLYFLHPFVLGLALSYFWHKFSPLIKGNNIFERGFKFGMYIVVLLTIPGMLISYSTFPVSFLMILSWSITALFEIIAAGIILAKINS